MRLISLALCLCATAAAADPAPLVCKGPGWTLDLGPETATLGFAGMRTELEILHRATARGAESPEALTLIGPRASAILILHDRSCGAGDPIEAQLLTQEGLEPVLLTGCCRPAA